MDGLTSAAIIGAGKAPSDVSSDSRCDCAVGRVSCLEPMATPRDEAHIWQQRKHRRRDNVAGVELRHMATKSPEGGAQDFALAVAWEFN